MMDTTEVTRCGKCGANNRVSMEKVRAGEKAVCGKCGAALSTGGGNGKVATVTDATFGEVVERATVPVLVDLWAPWCGPCRMLAPVIDKLAEEFAGQVRFTKLNVDENPATAGRFQVDGIPTLLVMKGGQEVDRLVGMMPGPEIARRLRAAAGVLG